MGHANHAAVAAAVSWSSTSRIVTVPETGMITCALSPGVEKTVGRPISTTTAKTASSHEYLDKAQGVATQATSSAVKRRTDAMRSSGLSMFAPAQAVSITSGRSYDHGWSCERGLVIGAVDRQWPPLVNQASEEGGRETGNSHGAAAGVLRRRALRHACLSSYVRGPHPDRGPWQRELKRAPARVQWDPERDLNSRSLAHRSLQLGLSGQASSRYADEWTVSISDVTPLAREIRTLVNRGDLDSATRLLPQEQRYPAGDELLLRP